jgi:hypothetical protein
MEVHPLKVKIMLAFILQYDHSTVLYFHMQLQLQLYKKNVGILKWLMHHN